jgi:hypothetical protein
MIETHYLHIPGGGRVTFVLWFNGYPIRVHDRAWLTSSACWKSERPGSCVIGCQPGFCNNSLGPVDQVDMKHPSDAARILRLLESPTHVFMGSHLHAPSFNDPARRGGRAIVGYLQGVRRALPGVKASWMTGTHTSDELSSSGIPIDTARYLRPAVQAAGFELLELGRLSGLLKEVVQRKPGIAMIDKLHFMPAVYEGFNQLLLLELCRWH